MRKLNHVMVTGGAGFIGSNFIRVLLSQAQFEGRVVNVDSLTYAGNPANLKDIDEKHGGKRYFFEKADIREYEQIRALFDKYGIDSVVHLAAESHVDRSIFGPSEFVTTNIVGTFTMLEAARAAWKDADGVLFHHVSTDEVYGSLGDTGYFTEDTPYDPKSPYSATKASSDLLVRAVHHTYGVPTTLSNCSNNYGPYQFPEKLIPLMIDNIVEEKPLPVYGDGRNIRDWLYVDDHCRAIWRILQDGRTGETYNIGGDEEWRNIDLVRLLCEKVAALQGKGRDVYERLITYVKDRPGHDRRYAVDCTKLKEELRWKPEVSFQDGLDMTIRWYMENRSWVENIKSGEYQDWIAANYNKR